MQSDRNPSQLLTYQQQLYDTFSKVQFIRKIKLQYLINQDLTSKHTKAMIIKSKSTKDLDSTRRGLGSRQDQHRISFSSILKNHKNANMHQSEMRNTGQYKQLSSDPYHFPKKMLFSNQPSIACIDSASSKISPTNNVKGIKFVNKSNSNNLFTTLINSKKMSECTASHETADSDYWGYSCSVLYQKRPQSKYFKDKQLIRNKSKNSKTPRQLPSEYFSQGTIDINKATKATISCDEQFENVNTTKESIQFDMDPYLCHD